MSKGTILVSAGTLCVATAAGIVDGFAAGLGVVGVAVLISGIVVLVLHTEES